MLFFLCFSSLFFHQTYAGARKKKNKLSKEKKKRTGSVFQSTWPTNDTPNSLCWAWSFFFFFFFKFFYFQTMKELNSFQSPRKLDFFWYKMTFLSGERMFSTHFNRSTLRAHSSFRVRSPDGNLERVLASKSNTQPGFVEARPHYSQQSPRLAILTEGIVAFGFPWPCTR